MCTQEELLEAINANYTEFISLSSGLVGVDRMIEDVRAPVDALRTDAAVVFYYGMCSER